MSSSKFTDALGYVSGYYRYKLLSESNAARPMWFSGFSRYATGPYNMPTPPQTTAELVDLFNPRPDDNAAFELYSKAKDPKSVVPARDDHAARVRVRVMASLRQTVGRQMLGADMNARTGADARRYEYDRKVAALGLNNALLENFKERT